MGPIVQQISAVFGSDLNLNRSSGSVDEIGGIIDKPFMVYAWKRSCLPMQNFLASHELIKPSRNRRRQPLVVFASSYGSSPSGSSDGAAGDPKVQQMLVDMVRIQVGKARMIEFVEERSQNLRNIADDVILEYNRIAYRTMKGFDASGSRVLRRLDADASAIEKELMIARAEMEAHSRDFEEFQVRIAYSRNEGLFFKNLYKSPKALRFKGSSTKGLVEKVR
ncbi:hypothetical protein KP509_14G096400 [Ceratopteris richardii]|uniref:Uncharacterized protein n=1 Tax=Ceratopteris richardii TaxID=49495 RepID=A0A8T2TEF0_CERRI|nr:hypothetical protein KP509_14G096400 [Ceratopteris richardii]